MKSSPTEAVIVGKSDLDTPASVRDLSRLGTLADGIGGFWTVGVLIVIIIALGIANSNFLSQAGWLATSVYATEVLVIALGQTLVVITAGIDLSLAGLLGFAAMSSAWVMRAAMSAHWQVLPTMLLGAVVVVLVGTGVGVVNGFLIAKLKLAPFIVTLGMLGIVTGGTLLLNGGREIVEIPNQWSVLGNTVYGGWLPFPVMVAAALCIITAVMLSQTRFGRHIYAIGSNLEAARRTGINVDRTLISVYGLAGLSAGCAGLLVMSRFGIAHPSFGANDLLPSIAAVVIGGASLFGGRGTVLGTIVGTAIISVLVTGLVAANVQPYWQSVAVGVIIITAVYIDQFRLTLRQR